ncbi:hypothetical protein GB931_01870 [Modestobacter sp. I12A-02628]|uniref:Uncharacterized protein n=1 Tax=Goekera deserti TaxID=2497753 RepID=A0A7K3WIC1_9ACTN|nr:hypothetical protein [Goekera deserti]MPQ96685.1 hypothetical protein [Goekera deserti]NDI47001.1 hypothetical protein [Goekera deserti]NEL56238.1 hypothetical protein [Goekera deserti]
MRLWKLLGLAGIAGVAATGAVLARDERQRRAYTPDDVRTRLRERAATAGTDPEPARARQLTGDHRPLVPAPGTRDGIWLVPAATTRRGRLRQRARWQLRHLPVLPGPLRRVNRWVHHPGPQPDTGAADGPA